MGAKFTITEPSPTPSTASYIRTGRGGAGNICRPSSSLTTTPSNTTAAALAAVSSNLSRKSSSNKPVLAGRGGAGNLHRSSKQQQQLASLDDEVDDFHCRRATASESQPPVTGHFGRGGAGNVFRRKDSSGSSDGGSEKYMSDGESVMSGSTTSARSGIWSRVSRTLSRD